MRGSAGEKSVLSGTEQQLYGRLVRAFPGHVILAHVALARLLSADRGAAGADVDASAGRHRQMVADFLICRPDFSAIAVVEFADAAPSRGAQREKHRRKDRLLQAAGIKVLRVAAGDIPNEHALKALIAALPVAGTPVPSMRRAS